MRSLFSGALGCAASLALPLVAHANDVTITSKDGASRLTGELVDITSTHFVLTTSVGRFRLDRSEAVCSGDACPSSKPGDGDVVIQGSDPIGK